MDLKYLLKNTDFQLRNSLDHEHDVIRSRSEKMMIFHPKIVRIGRNRKNERLFLTNRLVFMVETVLKIVIFLKILDGDLTKITKISRKVNGFEVLAEKLRFSASDRLGSSTRGNSEQERKNDDF